MPQSQNGKEKQPSKKIRRKASPHPKVIPSFRREEAVLSEITGNVQKEDPKSHQPEEAERDVDLFQHDINRSFTIGGARSTSH